MIHRIGFNVKFPTAEKNVLIFTTWFQEAVEEKITLKTLSVCVEIATTKFTLEQN